MIIETQVEKLVSDEKGRNVIILFCMSLSGFFIPPMPRRQKMNASLMINAPNESSATTQPNGWMSSQLFLMWLKNFI